MTTTNLDINYFLDEKNEKTIQLVTEMKQMMGMRMGKRMILECTGNPSPLKLIKS